MLSFCGYDLYLTVQKVIDRDHGRPAVCSAIDFQGRHWLVIEIDVRADHRSWLCVPTSPRAVELVAAGIASAGDVARRSSTGWVELIRTEYGRAVPDRFVPCSQLTAELPDGYQLPAVRDAGVVASAADRSGVPVRGSRWCVPHRPRPRP